MTIPRLLLSLVLAIPVLLTGCATPMALSNDTDVLKPDGKPIYLLTATLRNNYKPRYQPQVTLVTLSAGNEENKKGLIFPMDDRGKLESGAAATGNTYLIRFELDNGTYEIGALGSMAFGFPFMGSFTTPVNGRFIVTAPGVYYLGHVEASVRARVDNEFRAGGVIPLIDQAVVGASSGTFDVAIVDNFDQDEATFKSRFPALKDAVITKAILPPFDRARAQAEWEK